MLPAVKAGAAPRYAGQRAVAFIGVPGSGKSTLAAGYKAPAWIHLTLDDLRQTMWPPGRRTYWDVARASEMGAHAQRLLHAVQQTALNTALYEGFNVVLPDTHLRLSAFRREWEIVAEHGITIEWKLLDVSWETLLMRNETRPPEHRLPADVLHAAFTDMWADDAWWRRLPSHQIEVIE